MNRKARKHKKRRSDWKPAANRAGRKVIGAIADTAMAVLESDDRVTSFKDQRARRIKWELEIAAAEKTLERGISALAKIPDALRRSSSAQQKPIPGRRLERIVRFLFSSKTVNRDLMPVISDMQVEYFLAAEDGAAWKGRWIRLRGFYNVIVAAGFGKLLALVARIVAFWRLGP